LIGRRFIDVSVQSGIRFGLSRSFSGPNDKLMIVVNYNGEEKRFTAKKYPFKDPCKDA
jgi:L1 cell adhesion molecule like protein